MINGSCLCQSVQYAVSGPVGDIIHCHCETCRKAHASAFSSVSRVEDGDFTITQGREMLKCYESSPGKFRYFCQGCGSQIYAKRANTTHVILRLGTLDDDPGAKEAGHIWVSDKASWYAITGDLPQHEGFD